MVSTCLRGPGTARCQLPPLRRHCTEAQSLSPLSAFRPNQGIQQAATIASAAIAIGLASSRPELVGKPRKLRIMSRRLVSARGARVVSMALASATETIAATKELASIPASDQDGGDAGGAPAEERGLIVALVAAAYVIWQMDKVNMSVAILPMAAQFHWDPGEQGLIQSSLFWGYASTQIIGGFLATRYGGKRVLLGAVAIWSAATLVAPLAAAVSTPLLIASRVLVGIGEGLAPAAGLRMVATWIPEEERSRAVSTLGVGKTSGSIIGLLVAPVVITSLGWPTMFYSFGVLGLAWALVWSILGKDREIHKAATPRDASTSGTATGEGDAEPIPWLRILKTPQLWAIVAAHFCHDWGGYALLTWTPTYLNQALGYNLQGSSEITVIPSVLAVIVAALTGVAADSVRESGLALTTVRKIFQGLGFVIPCVCLGALGTLDGVDPSSPLPVALLTVGIAGGACSYAGLYSSHADLSAKYSGIVNGVSTTFGALAGVFSNAYAGYVLKATGSWAQAIFLPSVALYILGFVVYTAFYDATPIDWDASLDDGPDEAVPSQST